jgi:hypothetical protein
MVIYTRLVLSYYDIAQPIFARDSTCLHSKFLRALWTMPQQSPATMSSPAGKTSTGRSCGRGWAKAANMCSRKQSHGGRII